MNPTDPRSDLAGTKPLFTFLLPLLVFSLVFGWYYIYEALTPISVSEDPAGKISMQVPNGWPNRWIDRAPSPRDLAEAVNLPAVFPALLFELTAFGTEHRDDFERVRIFEVSFIGMFFWIGVGGYVDHLRSHRRVQENKLSRQVLAIAIAVSIVITLTFVSNAFGGLQIWTALAAGAWATAAILAIILRPRQAKIQPAEGTRF